MQQVFTEYPALYGTDDILYHVGRLLEEISKKPTQDNDTIIDGLKNAIINDVNLQNNLKGANGNQIQNYSSSLLVNGALERDNISSWTNNFTIGDNYKGLPSISFVSGIEVENTTNVFINKDKLYSIEFYGKTTGSFRAFLRRYDKNDNVLSNSGIDSLYLSNYTLTDTLGSFVNKKIFVSANIGLSPSEFNEDMTKARFYLYGDSGQGQVNSLIIKEISLGEPVPYTLPYLPKGQMVYDPATYETGIYTGTTVVWNIANGV